MMQSNEPQRPNDRDLELIDLINEGVNCNPKEFIEAGHFLEDKYSAKAVMDRDAAGRAADQELGVPQYPFREPRKLARFCQASADLLYQFGAFRPDAPDECANNPAPWTKSLDLQSYQKNLRDLQNDDLLRITHLILLLTWLATDPNADRLDVEITSLQNWAWDDKAQATSKRSPAKKRNSKNSEFKRLAARSILLRRNGEVWCDLLHQAWVQISRLKCIQEDIEQRRSKFMPSKGQRELIQLLLAKGDMQIAGIAKAIGRTKRTVERRAKVLLELGYISRNAGRYAATKIAGELSL